MSDDDPGDGRAVGSDVPRREDEALLTARATYTDDLSAPGTAHLVFVRSERAHARIQAVETAAAEAMDGVFGVYTWADVDASETPGVLDATTALFDVDVPGHPVLARETVRYQGQPIAAVVAESRYRARDAADAVEVDYDPLDAVVDPVEARAGDAPALFEAAPDNVVLTAEQGDREATDAAFERADRAVDLELENNRLISSALEPRAALARWDDADDRLTVEMTSQSPHGHRENLSDTLGIPERRIRVISPSVGGGFGHKGHHHPGEAMAAWSARRVDRPVKWTATRSGNYLAGAHARDHRTSAELAVDSDGTIQGLRVETDANAGGYALGAGPALAGWYGRLLSSQYEIPAIHCETRSVFTNTAPVHSYRGAGRPEAVYVTERLVDVAARELAIDPAEIRRRNQLSPEDFPYRTPVGAEYDSGEYEPALEKALAAVDYDEGAVAAGNGEKTTGNGDGTTESEGGTDGTYRGVGFACYVESTGGGFESGLVRAHPDGSVTVYAGTHSHGQGHETTYAQIVADELGVPQDDVDVVEGDTDRIPRGTGTFGSRSTITGGSAVAESAESVREQAKRYAADYLECDPADLVAEDGEIYVDGAPDRSVAFADVASAAHGRRIPDGLEPGLEETTFYEADGTAYTFGTHAARVAIDAETGALEIEAYVAVDDCGERINPGIVEGQVHGGVAQGIGQARSERAVYDDDGALVTRYLQDYGVPRAADLPDVETESTVTPSPHNPLGVKGIGEAGTIAAPPTIVNAVVDALSDVGVRHLDMPLTDERIWRAIHGDAE